MVAIWHDISASSAKGWFWAFPATVMMKIVPLQRNNLRKPSGKKLVDWHFDFHMMLQNRDLVFLLILRSFSITWIRLGFYTFLTSKIYLCSMNHSFFLYWAWWRLFLFYHKIKSLSRYIGLLVHCLYWQSTLSLLNTHYFKCFCHYLSNLLGLWRLVSKVRTSKNGVSFCILCIRAADLMMEFTLL